MKWSLMIFIIIVVCEVTHSWSKEDEKKVKHYVANRVFHFIEQETGYPLKFVRWVSVEEAARVGGGSKYFVTLELKRPFIDKILSCDAVVFKDTWIVPYYECDGPLLGIEIEPEFVELDLGVLDRDEIPIDDGEGEDDSNDEEEDEDDSGYENCVDADTKTLLRKLIDDLNEQVDETNDEFDMPVAMGMNMDDLKQGHYSHASMLSCQKKKYGNGMRYKVEMKADQDHVKQKCEIILEGKPNSLRIAKNQCQGQN